MAIGWNVRPVPGLVESTRCAALRVQEYADAERLIEERARAYALCPLTLELIETGLSGLPPLKMHDRILELVIAEHDATCERPIHLINLMAAHRYSMRLLEILEGRRQ